MDRRNQAPNYTNALAVVDGNTAIFTPMGTRIDFRTEDQNRTIEWLATQTGYLAESGMREDKPTYE